MAAQATKPRAKRLKFSILTQSKTDQTTLFTAVNRVCLDTADKVHAAAVDAILGGQKAASCASHQHRGFLQADVVCCGSLHHTAGRYRRIATLRHVTMTLFAARCPMMMWRQWQLRHGCGCSGAGPKGHGLSASYLCRWLSQRHSACCCRCCCCLRAHMLILNARDAHLVAEAEARLPP